MTAIPPTRRQWIAGAAASLHLHAASSEPPNLLFLIADDHAGYVLGCDGNRLARTPHLDRLASEGVRFAQHYCNSPVCTPSRQSFFTGLLPHAAGVTVLKTPLDENRPTLARQFRRAGYQTAVFGKMHFNRPAHPGLHGFDLALTEDAVQKQWLHELPPDPVLPPIPTKPPWRPFQDPARIWLNAARLPFPRRYEQMKSTWLARQACSYLEQHRRQPFALWVSFQEPHSPFDFPMEDRSLFGPARFAVPPLGPQDHSQIPLVFRDLSAPEKQGIAAAYYTSVEFLDRNAGVVLDKLSELQLDRNTLVVYMADHGYCLGQHGRFEKHCCYDPALRVPLIMRWPGRIASNRVVGDLTESVDVPATILDMLAVERLPGQHGQSLRPYLAGRRPHSPRQSIFSEYLENEEACLRTRRWKFIYCSGRRSRRDGYITDNPTPGRYVRLFDLKQDPGEFSDVSGRHPQLVQEFTRQMLSRVRNTHPESHAEPRAAGAEEALDWYLRPRDAD